MSHCGSTAHQSPPGPVAAALRRALALMRSGNAEERARGEADLEQYARAARSSDAMWLLGSHHDRGKRYAPAARWYEAAAQLGHVRARHRLAVMRFYGRGVPRDEEGGLAQLEELSMQHGYAPSQAQLGLYYKGAGPRQCPALAVSYLTMAADQGLARGRIGLGDCYKTGFGVPKDVDKALALYRAAATGAAPGTAPGTSEGQRAAGDSRRGGTPSAMYSLGSLLLKVGREAEGATWVRRAAEAGVLEATFHMGYLYHNGDGGLPRDMEQALLWYRRAADAGHAKSIFQLAKLYESGRPPSPQAGAGGVPPSPQAGAGGVPKNLPLAVHYYRKGAALRDPPCMNALGVCYAAGCGVPRDLAQARAWYSKAAALNDVHGLMNVAICRFRGVGGSVDVAGAVAALQRAATKGCVRALTQLGSCYLRGEGVRKDANRALALFGAAKTAGDLLGTYNYAVALLREFPGREAEAEALLLQQQDHGLSMLSLGRLYLQQGKEEAALQYLHRAASLHVAEACLSAGALYERRGDAASLAHAQAAYRRGAAMGNAACAAALQKCRLPRRARTHAAATQGTEEAKREKEARDAPAACVIPRSAELPADAASACTETPDAAALAVEGATPDVAAAAAASPAAPLRTPDSAPPAMLRAVTVEVRDRDEEALLARKRRRCG